MKGLKFTLDRLTLETIYVSFIRPVLEYGSPIWSGCTAADEAKLESVQLNAARIVTGAMHGTSNAKLYEELGWHTLAKRRDFSKLILMYKLANKLAPDNLCSVIPTVPNTSTYTTRQHLNLPHFRARTELFDKSFFSFPQFSYGMNYLSMFDSPDHFKSLSLRYANQFLEV